MKSNIGDIERVLRVGVGLAVLTLFFIGPQSIWGILGSVIILTGLVGFCPLYAIFSCDNNNEPNKKHDYCSVC